ncbi:hypothetical protein DFR58_104117 [Anaerobacterium chartisolvens]|uniref:Uncharacterized protein n=1 Tax=Anaerobacterium chartisolvens TaxID=1297424 RepID=A0A369BE14_9FIRM|nr:hypothetical protein [Anaerobacterium chartisolvens]RCX18848.1 hypothetical protein DFR58_104117 [Anaerobacterium chartisolvens]
MSKTNRFIGAINILLALALAFSMLAQVSVYAYSSTTEWKGYAVYRDGVSGFNSGLNDHAALMDEPNRTYYKPIIHAPGYSDPVQWDHWDDFMNGKKYLGIFKPKNTTITETVANSFVSKARELRGISYNVLDQIVYSAGSNTWVYPENISQLRCDGVVEYTYEWFGYRVGGPDNKWDITRNLIANYWEHSGFFITPRKQNQELLTKVSSGYPD